MPETGPEAIWRSLYDPETLGMCLWDTHCLSKHSLSGEHIVSRENTLSLRKTHCLSGKHIVSLVDIFSLREDYILAREDYIIFREDYIIFGEDCIIFRED